MKTHSVMHAAKAASASIVERRPSLTAIKGHTANVIQQCRSFKNRVELHPTVVAHPELRLLIPLALAALVIVPGAVLITAAITITNRAVSRSLDAAE